MDTLLGGEKMSIVDESGLAMMKKGIISNDILCDQKDSIAPKSGLYSLILRRRRLVVIVFPRGS